MGIPEAFSEYTTESSGEGSPGFNWKRCPMEEEESGLVSGIRVACQLGIGMI
ncbi:hypothetical protein M422DRAFT_32559 [Sphaerobolus stellatus SS14]|uniref:Uncharacterized protein n=1 Tax=Sphaerobolus stellatus (strain SS14) TaxID=990650 RepID=A0A0C9VEC2_SPHS4|nr:hypothetical protein M422DRAFT_34489 [Sphaerobolus stellatus SS14]KIJ39752.1 hypothetical protein M422DRAFT_32559 [Sphaerobolus stellatus SS14]